MNHLSFSLQNLTFIRDYLGEMNVSTKKHAHPWVEVNFRSIDVGFLRK